jgi:hypothetical protein
LSKANKFLYAMNSFEEDNLHLFCNHNLNTNDVNKLAEELASVFKINIEYNVVQNGETLQNTIAGESTSENISNLYNGEKNRTDFVLEIGDEALFISNEILLYNTITRESFEELSEIKNTLLDSYLKNTIVALKALGATKIVFAEGNNVIKKLRIAEHTFDQHLTAVKANTKYFTV